MSGKNIAGKEFYLGLDIGTDSVGWAVTDDEYVLQKYRSNLMWGVHLFDAAEQAAERRSFRTARRRLDRRQQRVALLQEFLAKPVCEKDPEFFLRLKESALFPEDSAYRSRDIFFADEDYTDKEYYAQYPTIHHLICELMNSAEPHDVRLVYLACAYILAHRGHFLSEVDKDKVSEVLEFSKIYRAFLGWFEGAAVEYPFQCEESAFSEILKQKSGISAKERALKALLFGGKAPVEDEEYPIKKATLLKLLAGGKIKLSELFKQESYNELEQNSITITAADFSETLEALSGVLGDGDAELLSAVKAMHDWALLHDILRGKKTISEAKAAVYEQHKSDLKKLKKIAARYLTKKQYSEIFRAAGEQPNYVKYSRNVSSVKGEVPRKFDCASQEDFCKFVRGYLRDLSVEEDDRAAYEYLLAACEDGTLCPKQVTGDNRVIPYQLYYAELRQILDNAANYLPTLNERDAYGSVRDKILQIMTFRIPYYVGPLVSAQRSDFAWMSRREGCEEGRIYPWNFHDIVDEDRSENDFIRRMTCKCTYLAGEDVLPKNSLLYCRFNVLNEINNLRINSEKISVGVKQSIYTEVFEKRQRVSVAAIKKHLIAIGAMQETDELTGIDTTVKSSLKSYHELKRLLTGGLLHEMDAERIIERITATTDKPRLKKWLRAEYPRLSDEDITYLAGRVYKDYGRLSRSLLCEICGVDEKTGETEGVPILTRMWETNDNLMQILADCHGYVTAIRAHNTAYYAAHPVTMQDKLREMYIPNAVTRSVTRTMEIAAELKKILPAPPSKIFIEMARGDQSAQKGKRTVSRKVQIQELLRTAREFWASDELDVLEQQLGRLDDSTLRSEKYYLYFTQLGRSMYSGKPIAFDRIGTDYYNVDHIFPQAKVKDDSLDNKVLVLSAENGEKKDDYPINPTIREKMSGFWKSLREKNLISISKYARLVRSAPFNDEELAGFINRQLVETRQSTKAVAQLIGDLFPESEIVYVKAGLVSDFRHTYDMLKCREVNDLHHAKDAYLNIVMGNVHDVKFTKSPVNFIQKGEKYSLKLTSLLAHEIRRGSCTAWVPERSISTVKRMMAKNSVRYVRYSYRRKGGFFNQMPERAGTGLAPRKSSLDPVKYGGYNNTTASHFALIRVAGMGAVIIPIELLYAERYQRDESFARGYALRALEPILPKKKYAGLTEADITFPYSGRILKINTLLEVDGFRMHLCAKDSKGKYIIISSANALITDKEMHDYIKRLAGFSEKSEKGKRYSVSRFDQITNEKNLALYDLIAEKCGTKPFCAWTRFQELGKTLSQARTIFESLSVTEQVNALLPIVSILKSGRSGTCDLSLIGESKQSAVSKLNAVLSSNRGVGGIYLIDQSPTGLFEKRSENLLTL